MRRSLLTTGLRAAGLAVAALWVCAQSPALADPESASVRLDAAPVPSSTPATPPVTAVPAPPPSAPVPAPSQPTPQPPRTQIQHRYNPNISTEQELKFGYYVDAEILDTYPLIENPDVQAVVDRIGSSLAQKSGRTDLNFNFKILNTNEPNAFAGPGGFVYITTGLLDRIESKDELAAVLGHEVAHVAERHSLRSIDSANFAQAVGVGLAIGAIVLAADQDSPAIAGIGISASQMAAMIMHCGFSREFETRADELGVEYSKATGHDPQGAVLLMDRFLAYEKEKKLDHPPMLLASHPHTEARKKHLTEYLKGTLLKKGDSK